MKSILETCSDDKTAMVVSYSRKVLKQTGDGHFSPIGGYDPDSNMALIMDVARFKYPAYWISADLLWDSLFPVDVVTQEPRGYYLLEKAKSTLTLSLLRLEMDYKGWSTFSTKGLPQLISNPMIKSLQSIDEVIPRIIQSFYSSFRLLKVREVKDDPEIEREFSEEVHKLLNAASEHPYYTLIDKTLQGLTVDEIIAEMGERMQKRIRHHKNTQNCEHNLVNVRAAMATIFLLSIPSKFFADLSPAVLKQIEDYRKPESTPVVLREEVQRIESQIETLTNMTAKCMDCDCSPLDLNLDDQHQLSQNLQQQQAQ